MRYMTYDEYADIGGALDFASFDRVVDRACGVVDAYTFGRVRNIANVPFAVKCCIRDLCECMAEERRGQVASKSQSAGGVSESVTYVTVSRDDANAEIRDIVLDWLMSADDDKGTPLLYRGCSR